MSDLIQRLRTRPTGDPYLHMLVHEAADAIERLTAERNHANGCAMRALEAEQAMAATIKRERDAARADERERCAKLCERMGANMPEGDQDKDSCLAIAAAIRAMSEGQ